MMTRNMMTSKINMRGLLNIFGIVFVIFVVPFYSLTIIFPFNPDLFTPFYDFIGNRFLVAGERESKPKARQRQHLVEVDSHGDFLQIGGVVLSILILYH